MVVGRRFLSWEFDWRFLVLFVDVNRNYYGFTVKTFKIFYKLNDKNFGVLK